MDISSNTFRVIGIFYWIYLLGIPLLIAVLGIYFIKISRKKNAKLDEIIQVLKKKDTNE